MAETQYRIPVLESFPWQETVIDRLQHFPPANASIGDRYLIPADVEPTSPWQSRENYIAWFDGVNWHYDPPFAGWVVYIQNEDIHLRYTGSAWISNYVDSSLGITQKELYVNSQAPANGTGTITRPFNRINDAIEAIIRQNDNNLYAYVIYIGPGSYPEMVVLESNNLFNLYFIGSGKTATIIDACCGMSIRSIIRNDCLENIYFTNMHLKDPVEFQGHIHQTKCGNNLVFDNCSFSETAHISLQNISSPKFVNLTEINSDFSISNVGRCYISQDVTFSNDKILSLETDPSANFPSVWTGLTHFINSSNLSRVINWRNTNGGSINFELRNGSFTTPTHEVYIPLKCTIDAKSSTILGNVTVNGVLSLNSSFVEGQILQGSGQIHFENQPASQIFNDSQVAGNSVKDALNHLLSLVGGSTSGDDYSTLVSRLDDIDSSLVLIRSRLTVLEQSELPGGTGGTGGTGSSGLDGLTGGTGAAGSGSDYDTTSFASRLLIVEDDYQDLVTQIFDIQHQLQDLAAIGGEVTAMQTLINTEFTNIHQTIISLNDNLLDLQEQLNVLDNASVKVDMLEHEITTIVEPKLNNIETRLTTVEGAIIGSMMVYDSKLHDIIANPTVI